MQGFAVLVWILIRSVSSSPHSSPKKDFKRENKTRRHETTPWSPLDMVHPFMKAQPDPGYTQFAQDVIDGRNPQPEHYSFEDDQSVFDDTGLKGVMKQLKSQKMGDKPTENSDSAEPPAAYAAEIAAYLSPGIGDPPSDMPSGAGVMLNLAGKLGNGNRNVNMMGSNNLLGRMPMPGPVGLPLKSSKYLGGSPTEENYMQLQKPSPNIIQPFHKPSLSQQSMGQTGIPGLPPDTSVAPPVSSITPSLASQGRMTSQEGMTTQGIVASQGGPLSGENMRVEGTMTKQMNSPIGDNGQELSEEKGSQLASSNQLMDSSSLMGSSNQMHIQRPEQEQEPPQQAMSLKPQENPTDVDVPASNEAASNQVGPPLAEGDTASGASRHQVSNSNGVPMMGEAKNEDAKGEDMKAPSVGMEASAMLLTPKKIATVTGSTRQKWNSTSRANSNLEKAPDNIRQELKNSLLGSALESYTDSIFDSKHKLNTLQTARNTSHIDTATTAPLKTETNNVTKMSEPPKAKSIDGKKKNLLEGNLMKLDKKKIVSLLANLMRKYKKDTLPGNEMKYTIANEDLDSNGISDELKSRLNSIKDVKSLEEELTRQGIKHTLLEQIKRFFLSKSSNSSVRDPYADIGSIGGASTASARAQEENAETRHSVHINLFDDKSTKEKNKCSKNKKGGENDLSNMLSKRHSVHVNLFDKSGNCESETKDTAKEESNIQNELKKLKDMVRQAEKTKGAIDAISEDKNNPNQLAKASSGEGGSAFVNDTVALMKEGAQDDGKNRYIKDSELDKKEAETVNEHIKEDREKDAARNTASINHESGEEKGDNEKDTEKENSNKSQKNRRLNHSQNKNGKEKEKIDTEEKEKVLFHKETKAGNENLGNLKNGKEGSDGFESKEEKTEAEKQPPVTIPAMKSEKKPREKVKGFAKEDYNSIDENTSQVSKEDGAKENVGDEVQHIKIPNTNFNVHDVKLMLRKIQKDEESGAMLNEKKILPDLESTNNDTKLEEDSEASSNGEMTMSKNGNRNVTLITIRPGRKQNEKKLENVVVQFNVTPMENNTDPKPSKNRNVSNNKYGVQRVENEDDKIDKTLDRKLTKNDSNKKEGRDLDVNQNKPGNQETMRHMFENDNQGEKHSHKDNIAIVDKMVVVDTGAFSVPTSKLNAAEESSLNALARLTDTQHMTPQSLASSASPYLDNNMSPNSQPLPQKESKHKFLNSDLADAEREAYGISTNLTRHKPVREESQEQRNIEGKEGDDSFIHEILTSEGLKGLKEEKEKEDKEEKEEKEKEEEPPIEAKEPPIEAKEPPTEAKEFGESSVEHYQKGSPENMDRKVERLFSPQEISNEHSSEGGSGSNRHSSRTQQEEEGAALVEDEKKGSEDKLKLLNKNKLREFAGKELKEEELEKESKSTKEGEAIGKGGRLSQKEGKGEVVDDKVQKEAQEDKNKSRQGKFSKDSLKSKIRKEEENESRRESSESEETSKDGKISPASGSRVEKLKEELKEKQSQLENLKAQLKRKLREKLTTKYLKLKSEAKKLTESDEKLSEQEQGEASEHNDSTKFYADENLIQKQESQVETDTPEKQPYKKVDESYSSDQQQNGKLSKMVKATDKEENKEHGDRKIETEGHSSSAETSSAVNYDQNVAPSAGAVADRKAKQEENKNSSGSKDSDQSEDGGMTVNILSAHDAPNVYKLMNHMKQNKKEKQKHEMYEKLTSTR